MALYENVFIVRQDTPNQLVDELTSKFSDILIANGGKVTKKEYWGIKSLTYKIKKNRKGHFVHFNIDAPSSALKEMENEMSLNEDVIRHLTIKVDKLDEEPSIMMNSKHDKEKVNEESSETISGINDLEINAGVSN